MRLINILFLLVTTFATLTTSFTSIAETDVSNNCVSFTVAQGTGCAWMCNYCADHLGTDNYYFTDGVCTYQTGGCVGDPVAGKQYTCCSASIKKEL